MSLLCDWKEVLNVAVALLAAWLAYWLGLRAYFRQREFENVRRRYLESGVDLVCSQIDYALGVYRHNWTLMLRTLWQYREWERQVKVEDFFREFVEVDQAQFQLSPVHKVRGLLKDSVALDGYQLIFAFVQTANDKIKAEFGAALREMLETANHPRKAGFIMEAEQMFKELSEQHSRFYLFLGVFTELGEMLERENLSRTAIAAFSARREVKDVVQRLREALPDRARDESQSSQGRQNQRQKGEAV